MKRLIGTVVVFALSACLVYLVAWFWHPNASYFLGGTDNVQIIASATSVTAWHTAAWFKPERRISGEDYYQKAGEPVPVTGRLKSELTRVLLNKWTYDYHPGTEKGSIAQPCVVVTFSNDTGDVDVFFSFADDSLQVGKSPRSSLDRTNFFNADFDSSRAKLLRIVKAIFASDMRMQLLSETHDKGCFRPETTLYWPKVSEILPPDWRLEWVSTNAAPYGFGLKLGQRAGTHLEFVGSTIVKGPRGINDENESFQIWVMPPDYAPTKPDVVPQFEAAKLLGTNESVAIYYASFTSGTPSWTTWKEDLPKSLGLK